MNRFRDAAEQTVVEGEHLAGGRAGQLLQRLTRRVTALVQEPEFVQWMSRMLTLGARPEADLWPDSPEHDRENRLTAWTRSGVLSRSEAETLLALDRSTTWRTSV